MKAFHTLRSYIVFSLLHHFDDNGYKIHQHIFRLHTEINRSRSLAALTTAAHNVVCLLQSFNHIKGHLVSRMRSRSETSGIFPCNVSCIPTVLSTFQCNLSIILCSVCFHCSSLL